MSEGRGEANCDSDEMSFFPPETHGIVWRGFGSICVIDILFLWFFMW